MKQFFRSLHLNWTDTLDSIFGSALLAFGLYNVHALSGVTEGGVLGLTLLLDHWFSISPSVSGAILNVLCYAMGWKLLGRRFLAYSFISTASFSLSYKLYEQFPPLFPEIANHPLLAALVGAVFVGVGAGVCVRAGGAPGGDDALAMSVSHVTGWGVERVYRLSDLVVLLLSVTYIPAAYRRFAPDRDSFRSDHRADSENSPQKRGGQARADRLTFAAQAVIMPLVRRRADCSGNNHRIRRRLKRLILVRCLFWRLKPWIF